MDYKRLDEIIERNGQAMIESIRRSIGHISTKAAPAGPGAPFGIGIRDALEGLLAEGEGMGFRSRNVDGYAGHVEMGEGEEMVAILAHVDVVPTGSGWTVPPFEGTVKDGRVYGRGVLDNKGPGVVALYAMKAIAEAGIPLDRRVRLILGGDEESGWECMDHYFASEDKPLMAFTPDGCFPIIVGEKGLLAIHLAWPDGAGNGSFSLDAGTAINAVPSEAACTLTLDPSQVEKLLDSAKGYMGIYGKGVTVEIPSSGKAIVSTTGKAAHGSTPKEGENAIIALASFLVEASSAIPGLLPVGARKALTWAVESIGLRSDGSGLGVATHHDPTGDLTANVGMFRTLEDGSVEIGLDIRFPFGIQAETILAAVGSSAPAARLEVISRKEPIYMEPSHPLVKALGKSYEEVTGEKAEPICIGGTTYAKAIPDCVAFGAAFPDDPEVAHQADEFWKVESIMKAARIFARAIVELASGNSR